MSLRIRAATPADTALIKSLVAELAEYEKLAHEAKATEADFARALFGPEPKAFAEIAELGGRPIGFSLWFYTFSTFVGRHGVYLEDLYVRPEARGLGAGRALMASLARRCVEEGLGRMEWAVLDWNAPAIAVYDRVGSATLKDWSVRRLTGEALRALAEG
jgi:GNAT superfamily N-acetyltransferase